MNLGPRASTPYIRERDAVRRATKHLWHPEQAGHCLPVDTRQRKPSSPELHAGLFDDVPPKLGL